MLTYFGQQPVNTTCHSCKANIITRTVSETGSNGKIIACKCHNQNRENPKIYIPTNKNTDYLYDVAATID